MHLPATRTALVIADLAVTVTSAAAQERRMRGRQDRAPKVGQDAPDFELQRVIVSAKDAKEKATKSATKKKPKTLKLSSFEGKKPVVLVFGSFT